MSDDHFDVVSYQYRGDVDFGLKAEDIRNKMLRTDRIMPVSIVETNHPSRKDGYECRISGWLHTCGQQAIRKEIIYPVYFSGGSLELILEESIETESFEYYDKAWDYMFYARSFLESLPFWEMSPEDHLLIKAEEKGEVFSNNTVLALSAGGGEGYLDLRQMPPLRQQWFNPREGVF